MRRGLTWPWIRIRPLLARFSEPVWSGHLPSWADFITTTPELKFSVLTTRQKAARSPKGIQTGCDWRVKAKGGDGSWLRFGFQPVAIASPKANNRAMIRIRGLLKPGTVWRTATCLCWRLQFTYQPANVAGLHRVQRHNDFFDVIAFGAVERAKFESCRPRRDMSQPHANLALWAAESLNCEQWDCGWVIGHCIPPLGQAGAQNSQSPVDAQVGR